MRSSFQALRSNAPHLGEPLLRFAAYAESAWISDGRSFPGATRRCAAALGVIAIHIAAFMLLRDELLRQRSAGETPEFVSLFVAADAHKTRENPSATRPRQRVVAPQVPHLIPQETAPQAIRAPRIDWRGEAEQAARDQVASEADRKRRADWLSRGTDVETHPLVLAMKPMFGKTPEFGWSHEHTHRIEYIPSGGLVFWINRRCLIVFVGLAIMPACMVGHIEPNGALFEHMSDPTLPQGPNTVP